MPDPLSITTGVLTLITHSISAVQACQTYVTKYQLAGLSIAALRTECASIRLALLQIQNFILRNDGKGARRDFEQYVLEEYEAVISACSLTFSLLKQRLDSFGLDGLNERNQSDVKSKLNSLWNEPTMETIRQSIRGQAIAITLLLTAFQSDTTTKTYNIMKSQEVQRSLLSVSNDAKSLRDSFSITSVRRSNSSITGSVIGDEEFEFDDMVINSTAYRRVFMKQKKISQMGKMQKGNVAHRSPGPLHVQSSHHVFPDYDNAIIEEELEEIASDRELPRDERDLSESEEEWEDAPEDIYHDSDRLLYLQKHPGFMAKVPPDTPEDKQDKNEGEDDRLELHSPSQREISHDNPRETTVILPSQAIQSPRDDLWRMMCPPGIWEDRDHDYRLQLPTRSLEKETSFVGDATRSDGLDDDAGHRPQVSIRRRPLNKETDFIHSTMRKDEHFDNAGKTIVASISFSGPWVRPRNPETRLIDEYKDYYTGGSIKDNGQTDVCVLGSWVERDGVSPKNDILKRGDVYRIFGIY